jgi:uncharacterized protein
VNPLFQDKLPDIAGLCEKNRARALALFGTASGAAYDPSAGAVEMLVDFHPMTPVHHADRYFGLLEDLERLFGARVDLLELSAVRNPHLRREIEQTQVSLYDAR